MENPLYSRSKEFGSIFFIFMNLCESGPTIYIELYNIYFAAYFRYFHGAGEEL